MTNQDLSNFSMLDLFRLELETQAAILSENLLKLETQVDSSEALACLMRAAHSIKGAARIVQIEPVVEISHVMEDCFVAAQQGKVIISSNQIDFLLQAIDFLLRLTKISDIELELWLSKNVTQIETIIASISLISDSSLAPKTQETKTENKPIVVKKNTLNPQEHNPVSTFQNLDRGIRVSSENLNRLMVLAGESLVETNWLQPFSESLQKLKQQQNQLSKNLEKMQELLADSPQNQLLESQVIITRKQANESYQFLTHRLNELDNFLRRSTNLSDRLYREVIATQMRPFADRVDNFPRIVRDLARQLGKQVKLEIIGKSTPVDREILDKLEAPLIHLIRNAIDHGIESPQERLVLQKPAEGIVQLEAIHQSGILSITVSDDGRGINFEQIRTKIVNQGMVNSEIAKQLSETELVEFLFLPGFSTVETVTEISGRGVGLDIVQSMVQQVGGKLRAISQPNRGIKFQLQLPLTLSVIRTILVEISGEIYAFAATYIEQLVMLTEKDLFVVENRLVFKLEQQNIGLILASQILNLNDSSHNLPSKSFPVIIIGNTNINTSAASGRSRFNRYGVVVDQFLGVRDLVVKPLDPRLGKVQDISATALMDDGSIVLIVDVEDLVRSIDKILVSQQLSKVNQTAITNLKEPLRVLIVDDSITVREVERKILENHGYKVDVAINGIDAWNAIRTNHYDLIITDVDMPRMNGIELVTQIRNHPNFKSLPVIIVSYKDREEDYLKGLDVGANYYLTKSSFHDDTFLKAVIDLIGN
jgi:two-component system, chemotaxis family, sensor histidine kinase and response regulator WspE